jgi:hypothetical protein
MNHLKPPTLERLEHQIGWYDRKSQIAQRSYKVLKLLQVIATGLIPLVAVFGLPEPERISAVLALVALILEGAQQLNQYQQNWISYRSTCEALKHEKHLYLAGAGPYLGANDALVLLADRVEALISQEHAKWVSVQEHAVRSGKAQGSREKD